MTPNLPSHLQEKLYSEWNRRKSLKYPPISLDEIAEGEFIAGYRQAYSDILQELGPVVELVNGGYEQMQYMNPNVKESTYNKGVLDVCRRISKHLKERIFSQERTGG